MYAAKLGMTVSAGNPAAPCPPTPCPAAFGPPTPCPAGAIVFPKN